MKTQKYSLNLAGFRAFPASLLALAVASAALAQEDGETIEIEIEPIKIENPAEEVLVLGRFLSSAQKLVLERQDSDNVVDLLGAEQIARVGDSNIADALRRVPGLTLVDGKFIYIRGLGERYINVTLNGAAVPSPDLTRNVLPLDIFPTSIVESLAVEKTYESRLAATFAGGAIDIRTVSIPDDFFATIQVGGGLNSISGTHLDYPGSDDFGEDDGSRALPGSIPATLSNTFVDGGDFNLSALAIQDTAARNGNPITSEQAELINRGLALDLNRNLDITEQSSAFQDFSLGGGIGDSFDLGRNFTFGILGTANYGQTIRTQERIQRNVQDPTIEFTEETKSTQNASLTLTAGAALTWGDDHKVETKNFLIRNTDDEAFQNNRFTESTQFGDGGGLRDFEGIFEQRELQISQFLGSHKLGEDTLDALGLGDSFVNDLEFNWFVSTSEATTDIPNAFFTTASFDQDPDTLEISNVNITLGGVINSGLVLQNTDLDDELESSGFEIKLPVTTGDLALEFSGGARTDRRARVSDQLNLLLTADGTVNSTPAATISERFSDDAINDPTNGFELDLLTTDFSPALASTQTDSTYGQVKFAWKESYSLVLGARYEDYRQVSAEFDSQARISPVLPSLTPDVIAAAAANGELPEGIFQDDQFFPSATFKFSAVDFWAESFNLFLNWSQTTTRPDLREITDTSFRDPLTDFIITGNSSVIPSDVTNIDLRGDWVFGNGNSFTVSLFAKDIENPIEIFSDTALNEEQRGVVENAATGEVAGIEVEWLVNLDFLGGIGSQFFSRGNITALTTNEIDASNVEGTITNDIRPLTGASDFILNLVFGFDSDNGKHSAGLAFNTFSERVFISGNGGFGDSFEQPFDSLDLTYTYFFTDDFNVRFRARNLLDDENVITQEFNDNDVVIFEQTVGQSYNVSFQYKF